MRRSFIPSQFVLAKWPVFYTVPQFFSCWRTSPNEGRHRSVTQVNNRKRKSFRLLIQYSLQLLSMSYTWSKGMKCIWKGQIDKLGSDHFIQFTQQTYWSCNCESISKVPSFSETCCPFSVARLCKVKIVSRQSTDKRGKVYESSWRRAFLYSSLAPSSFLGQCSNLQFWCQFNCTFLLR